MKKVKWLKVIKGMLFIVIGIIFMSAKFYIINQYVDINGVEWLVSNLNYASFQMMFGEIFKQTSYSDLLFVLFTAIGIINIIEGVKKNGN